MSYDPAALAGSMQRPTGPLPPQGPPGVGNVKVHRQIDYTVTTSGSPPSQQKAGSAENAAQLALAALHEAKRQHEAATTPNVAPVTVTITEVIAPIVPPPR